MKSIIPFFVQLIYESVLVFGAGATAAAAAVAVHGELVVAFSRWEAASAGGGGDDEDVLFGWGVYVS